MQNDTSALNPTAIHLTEPPKLVDAARCAAAISAPKSTLYKMVRKGLPVYRVGSLRRSLRFDIEEVLAWLRRPVRAGEP